MSNLKIGKLKFKQGIKAPVFAKQSKKQTGKRQSEEEDAVEEDKIIQYQPKQGTGSITVSGRTLHGADTIFKTQVEKGDYIIIVHPVFKSSEERQVTLVLSDKSLLLQQPFMEQYSSFVDYLIRKKTKIIKGQNLTKKYKQQIQQIGKSKGIKKEQMSVRLKKGMWSYETKKVEVAQGLSREQLLDQRQKLIKDKHCW